jgi:uncharacterized protein
MAFAGPLAHRRGTAQHATTPTATGATTLPRKVLAHRRLKAAARIPIFAASLPCRQASYGGTMSDFQTTRTLGAGATTTFDEGLRTHMNRVYGQMSVAMLVTAAVAWGVGTSDTLVSAIFTTPLKWVVMFAPVIMVFAFGAVLNRLSAAAAQLYFYAYAALMGLSLAFIFAVYTQTSIASTFLATAAAFAGLSLYGYTTKRDLSGMGSFLMMGLIGLMVAMLINIFLASSAVAFAISFIGVLLFAGLTAYDTQAIKAMYLAHAQSGDSEWLGKSSIMGALKLYLDFINLFMFLLQFMGNNRD